MDNHFSRFRVQNFKCFDDLTLDNLGLINIIVGDNNVGKTSLLEALLFTEAEDFEVIRGRWADILQVIRGMGYVQGSPLAYFINRKKESWDSLSYINFDITSQGYGKESRHQYGISLERLNNAKIEILKEVAPETFEGTLTNFPTHKNTDGRPMPYVYFHLGYGKDLPKKYSNILFDKKKRQELIESLKSLIPKITYIELAEILEQGLAILINQEDEPTLPLTSFGEGAIKLFRLLMEIIEWSHQRLMIDEIETGMHHSRMIPFWQAVLNTAYSQDTQLFATTHSLECLQKLHEVLEKPENEHLREKVRIIKLAKTAKKGIQAYIYPYENFEYSLENDIEIR